MTATAANLRQRVLVWQTAFTIGTTLLLAVSVPRLLLLAPEVGAAAARALFYATAGSGAVGLLWTWWVVWRQRFVLRTLAVGSRSVEPFQMEELGKGPSRITYGYASALILSLCLLTVPGARPALLDITTTVSLALLAAVIVAASALPLHVVVRNAFVGAFELAPPDVMGDAVEAAEKIGVTRRRMSRRVLAAVVAPVALVAIGSALITNAHLRRADEGAREESARALARAALELGPGVVGGAGLDDASKRAADLGFFAQVRSQASSYLIERDDDGVVALTTPLDRGSATIRFSGSTVPVMSFESLLITLLVVVLAAIMGATLGRALSGDMKIATRGVRLLGTDAVISGGTRMVTPARFKIVGDLGAAIERLAERFHVFAGAQERSIEAREAATRMRGLFFASVSHDLKSPLNAILGFTELVRQESLTPEQTESLDLIQKRGRELLALIEAILDAARVEAGQLSLVHEEVDVADLVWSSIDKGRDLGGEREVPVTVEIDEGLPTLRGDRVRMGRALAMFIGHALRTAERPPVRVRASLRDAQVVVEIEVPSTRFSAPQLAAMLNPGGQPGASENRGLALGLSLARSVVELHDGSVEVIDRGLARSAFQVLLPR